MAEIEKRRTSDLTLTAEWWDNFFFPLVDQREALLSNQDKRMLFVDLLRLIQERLTNVGVPSATSRILSGEFQKVADTEFDYIVTSAFIYLIGGTQYTVPINTVFTLDPAVEDSRFDAVVLTTSNTIVVVEGAEADDPRTPSINQTTQLLAGYVLVTSADSSIEQLDPTRMKRADNGNFVTAIRVDDELNAVADLLGFTRAALISNLRSYFLAFGDIEVQEVVNPEDGLTYLQIIYTGDGSGTPYTLPTMTDTIKGGAKLGSSLAISADVLNVAAKSGKVVHVNDTSGDNATAQRGNLLRPYLTLSAGLAASQAGDTIIATGAFSNPSTGFDLRGGRKLLIPEGSSITCQQFFLDGDGTEIIGGGTINATLVEVGNFYNLGFSSKVKIKGITINGRAGYGCFTPSGANSTIIDYLTLDNVTINCRDGVGVSLRTRYNGGFQKPVYCEINNCKITSAVSDAISLITATAPYPGPDDLTPNTERPKLIIRNSTLIAPNGFGAIHAGLDFIYEFSGVNYKNQPHTGTGTVVNALAATQGDGFSVGLSGGPSDNDYIAFDNLAAFPATGEDDLLYLAKDTNLLYRWNGSAYVGAGAVGVTFDAVPTAASNNAVRSGGVFDALATKAAELAAFVTNSSPFTTGETLQSFYNKTRTQLTSAIDVSIIPLAGDVGGTSGATVLATTGVTAGSYTNVNLTVDAKGRVTAVSSGAAGAADVTLAGVQTFTGAKTINAQWTFQNGAANTPTILFNAADGHYSTGAGNLSQSIAGVQVTKTTARSFGFSASTQTTRIFSRLLNLTSGTVDQLVISNNLDWNGTAKVRDNTAFGAMEIYSNASATNGSNVVGLSIYDNAGTSRSAWRSVLNSAGTDGNNQFQFTTNYFGGSVTPTAALHAAPSTAAAASLRIPAGTAPTTPNEGDAWQIGNNFYAYTASTAYILAKTLTVTGTLDFASTVAQTSNDQTITLAGASPGDVVVLGVPTASVNANCSFSAWVSATNTVTVRLNNYSAGTIDPASGTFRVSVLKY